MAASEDAAGGCGASGKRLWAGLTGLALGNAERAARGLSVRCNSPLPVCHLEVLARHVAARSGNEA